MSESEYNHNNHINPFKVGDYARGKDWGSISRVDEIIDYHTVNITIIKSGHSHIIEGKQYGNICVNNIEKINNKKTEAFK